MQIIGGLEFFKVFCGTGASFEEVLTNNNENFEDHCRFDLDTSSTLVNLTKLHPSF